MSREELSMDCYDGLVLSTEAPAQKTWYVLRVSPSLPCESPSEVKHFAGLDLEKMSTFFSMPDLNRTQLFHCNTWNEYSQFRYSDR